VELIGEGRRGEACLALFLAACLAACLAALTLTVAGACGGAPAGPGGAAAKASAAPPAVDASVDLSDFKITPGTFTLSGPAVRIAVYNDGAISHNLYIGDASGTVVMYSRTLAAGQSETIVGSLPPGTYTTYCELPGHESLGMEGTLIVF
jgi:uncharacterized cupredoxin-like copper-binding protein